VCLLVIVACVLTAPRNWSPSTTDTANFEVLARPAPLVQASQVAGPGARSSVGSTKIANVLNALPRSAQRGAKAAPTEIWNAKEKEHAQAAAKTFAADYASKCPKATAKVTYDLDVLLAFSSMTTGRALDPPAHHPFESTFTTVRLRH
jgi:hypothetical protein